jgi:diguanylate cyclase (GGDEF)-like protein/PAS domain S-box-containing protein
MRLSDWNPARAARGSEPPASSVSGTAIPERDIALPIAEIAALRSLIDEQYDLIENANDIIYTHDLQGRFTYVNRAGVKTYGYSREEILGMTIGQIVDPASLQLAIENIARKVRGEERTEPYEVLTRAKDGSPIWVEVSTRMVHGEDGTRAYVQGIARDISERKRGDAEIGASHELLRATIESTADGILVVDCDGRVVHANARFAELWRIPMELIEERDDNKLIASVVGQLDEPEAFLAKVRELYRSRDEDLDTLRFKDGRVFERYSRPLLASEGVAGRVWSFRDVTEQKRAEAVLQDSEHLYRQLFDGHSAVQVLIDMETRVVVEPNAAACEFYGYERDRFVGMDLSEIDTPIPERESTELVAPADQRRGVFTRRHRLASGEFRDVDAFVGAVDVGGRPLVLVIVQDVTERRRAEAALSTHQRLLEDKSALLQAALQSERERARRDPLTGTLNHAAIAGALRTAIADSATRSLAMAMIDVDGLKAANDTYGHQMGDAVLVAVAEALERDGAIVGRYGGDEFVALLPGATRDAAERYREGVTAALADMVLTDVETGARVSVVASMGLAMFPEEAHAIEDLIKAADNAMFVIKRERAAEADVGATTRALAGDRAAKMVGEIVPFLTSPGSLDEKLRLVARRLTTGVGYAGVSFALFKEEDDEPSDLSSFAEAPSELVERWDETDVEEPLEDQPLRPVLDRTQRPVIIDDVATTPFINETRRNLLLAAGIRSAVVAPMVWQGNVVGTLSAGGREVGGFGPRDAQFLNAVATQVTAIVRTASLVDDLQSASGRLLQAHTETVLMLANAAEAHDHSTGRHLHRVRAVTEALARELGHGDEAAKEIGLAAVLHDIGKIRVPDYVLTSPDSLGDDEWALMKHHTVWGGEFLGERPGFGLAAAVARCHHERWDGSGYPAGLTGDQIPEAAAITSVADSLDAMTNDRPYRRGRPIADAIVEVQAWSGRQFSPSVVDALVRLYHRGALPGMDDEAVADRDDLRSQAA